MTQININQVKDKRIIEFPIIRALNKRLNWIFYDQPSKLQRITQEFQQTVLEVIQQSSQRTIQIIKTLQTKSQYLPKPKCIDFKRLLDNFSIVQNKYKFKQFDLQISFYAQNKQLLQYRQAALTYCRFKVVKFLYQYQQYFPTILFKIAQMLDCFIIEKGRVCQSKQLESILYLACKFIVRNKQQKYKYLPIITQDLRKIEMQCLLIKNSKNQFSMVNQIMYNSFLQYIPIQLNKYSKYGVNIGIILWYIYQKHCLPFKNAYCAPALLLWVIHQDSTIGGNIKDLSQQALVQEYKRIYEQDFDCIQRCLSIFTKITQE